MSEFKKILNILSEQRIPDQIISQFDDIAGTDKFISMYDLYNMQQSFLKGSQKYRSLMGFLFNDTLGSQFFSIFSTGFSIDDLKNFDSTKIHEYTKVDDIKLHSEQLVSKFKDFNRSEIVYQLYKFMLDGNDFEFRKIKDWTKSKPSLTKLFDTEVGKLVLGKIHEKKIKTINDVITFLTKEDEDDYKGNVVIDVNDVDVLFKKFNSDTQTYFKDAKHYVCSVYTNEMTENAIREDIEDNDQSLNYGPQRVQMSQLFDMYSKSVTSHSSTAAVGHFTLGWVRFSIVDLDGDQSCVIDELQSDLVPYTGNEIDQHKVYLPQETFETFLKDVNYVYKLILQKFIYEIRDEYGYEKIYAPTYDVKKEVTKVQGNIDKERFSYLSDDEIEMLKGIKPPMFPYKQILPSFGFSTKTSLLPGFMVLEAKQLTIKSVMNEMFFGHAPYGQYTISVSMDKDSVKDTDRFFDTIKFDVTKGVIKKRLERFGYSSNFVVTDPIEEDDKMIFTIIPSDEDVMNQSKFPNFLDTLKDEFSEHYYDINIELHPLVGV